jgi:sugar phosphate isomerase/epimerase
VTELMALYWTVSGPVDVHYGREWSLFDWRDRCAEAAKVGFRGIGLWHADVKHQLETRTLGEMKQIFDDAGLEYLEVEFLADFFVEPGEPARDESDALRRQLFETAAAFDAHHIKVGNIPGTPCELGRLTEELAALCADAAQHTDAKVAYEFMPFDVNVDTLDKALELAAGAGAPNGGLAIDTWHMSKLGIAPAELQRIPAEQIAWVELSDGQHENMADPIDETINHRRLPGEGEFDIPGYVAALQEAGYAGPWGVEVLSAQLRSLPIEEEFRRAYETTLAQFRAGVASGEAR